MNAAAERDDDFLFAEIARLKQQRDDCTRQLVACRHENTQLRAEIAQLKGEK